MARMSCQKEIGICGARNQGAWEKNANLLVESINPHGQDFAELASLHETLMPFSEPCRRE
jgi:hypothetical protein